MDNRLNPSQAISHTAEICECELTRLLQNGSHYCLGGVKKDRSIYQRRHTTEGQRELYVEGIPRPMGTYIHVNGISAHRCLPPPTPRCVAILSL